jgi:hypothetical protein
MLCCDCATASHATRHTLWRPRDARAHTTQPHLLMSAVRAGPCTGARSGSEVIVCTSVKPGGVAAVWRPRGGVAARHARRGGCGARPGTVCARVVVDSLLHPPQPPHTLAHARARAHTHARMHAQHTHPSPGCSPGTSAQQAPGPAARSSTRGCAAPRAPRRPRGMRTRAASLRRGAARRGAVRRGACGRATPRSDGGGGCGAAAAVSMRCRCGNG